MESKVKCLYVLVLCNRIEINELYRKWKSEFDGFNSGKLGNYNIRHLKDIIKLLNKTNIPTSISDVGKFIENNIGFGQ